MFSACPKFIPHHSHSLQYPRNEIFVFVLAEIYQMFRNYHSLRLPNCINTKVHILGAISAISRDTVSQNIFQLSLMIRPDVLRCKAYAYSREGGAICVVEDCFEYHITRDSWSTIYKDNAFHALCARFQIYLFPFANVRS